MLSFSYLWLIILKYVPLVLKGQLEHEESNFLDYQPSKKNVLVLVKIINYKVYFLVDFYLTNSL